MYTNIIKRFSSVYRNTPEMWNKLSSEYKELKLRDPEMLNGLILLGEVFNKMEEASKTTSKPEGLSVEDALKMANDIKSDDSVEDYGFILFVLIKNLEHSGLLKIVGKPERIVKKAMKDHAKKRSKK